MTTRKTTPGAPIAKGRGGTSVLPSAVIAPRARAPASSDGCSRAGPIGLTGPTGLTGAETLNHVAMGAQAAMGLVFLARKLAVDMGESFVQGHTHGGERATELGGGRAQRGEGSKCLGGIEPDVQLRRHEPQEIHGVPESPAHAFTGGALGGALGHGAFDVGMHARGKVGLVHRRSKHAPRGAIEMVEQGRSQGRTAAPTLETVPRFV